MNAPLTDPRVVRAIELVWREAKLLDDKAYETWQELYTEDGIYVIPIDHDATDFKTSLNMVFDDTRMRKMRVDRMVQGYAPSSIAAARTVRVVARFTVTEVSDTEVRLSSAQMISAYKRNEFETYGAELEHVIRLADDGDRIALKVIRLPHSEDAVTASGYLL